MVKTWKIPFAQLVILFMLFITLLLAPLIGCSPGADIQLRGPKSPQAPGTDVVTPVEEPPGTETGRGDPVSPPSPVPTPTPAPGNNGYYAFCHGRYPPYINAVSSFASASGAGIRLDFQDVSESVPLPTDGAFDGREKTLEYHRFVQPLLMRETSSQEIRADLVFSAVPINRGAAGAYIPRNIYTGTARFLDRVGRAKFLATEMEAYVYAARAGEKEGFEVKTFTVSDHSKYIVVLNGAGAAVFDSKTKRDIGTLSWPLKSGRSYLGYFSPSLREADMSFAVSYVDEKSVISTDVYHINQLSSGKLQVGPLILSVTGLRRPLLPVVSQQKMNKEFRYYGIQGDTVSSSKLVLGTPARVSSGKVIKPAEIKNLSIRGVGKSGHVPSAVLVWRDLSGELLALVPVEDFEYVGGGIFGTGYKVHQAAAYTLSVDEGASNASPVSAGASLEYPGVVKQEIESGIFASRFQGLKDIMFSPDGRAIFGLFSGGVDFQIYRFSASGIEGVSRTECSGLALGVAP